MARGGLEGPQGRLRRAARPPLEPGLFGSTSDAHAEQAEIERRRSLAYRWCLTAAGDAQRRGIAERARSFAQHALDLAVSPDEVADAANARGAAHQLMGDGSPALAAFRVAADALIAAGAPDADRAAYLCARVTEISIRWVGSLREPVDQRVVWDYIERGLTLAGDRDSEARARLLLVRSFWGWGVRRLAAASGITRSSDEREADAAQSAEMAARLGLADVESGRSTPSGQHCRTKADTIASPRRSTADCSCSPTCAILSSVATPCAWRRRTASTWAPTRRPRRCCHSCTRSKLGAVWSAARVELALALRGDDPAAASYHAKRALDVFEALGSRDEIERLRALLAG